MEKYISLKHHTVTLRGDDSEKVDYNFKDFPIYVRRGRLSHYPNHTFVSHWHDDLELIRVLSGSMDYNINGEIVTLSKGSGIIVNSRQIHYGFSDRRADCDFICILINPLILCTCPAIEQTFVAPVIDPPAFSFLLLSEKISWQKTLLAQMDSMYASLDHTDAILTLQESVFSFWRLLCSHCLSPSSPKTHPDSRLSSLKDMMRFMQIHYKDKITLGQIASSGRVCKSSCCSLFHTYLHQTPFEWLIDYRLRKSMELLERTDLSVLEISAECGFSGASYYTKTFREHFGRSPREYRKEQNKEGISSRHS